MTSTLFKIILKTGVFTSVIMLIFELFNLLFIYHYFKFEYYLAAVAIIALLTGIILTKKHYIRIYSNSTGKDLKADLTNKETQILKMISEGKSNKEIASLNFVEISTIKTHINNIYFKLGVKNRTGAIEIYRKCHLESKSTFSPPHFI